MEKVHNSVRENPLYEMPRPLGRQSFWDTAIWLYRCRHFVQREDYASQEDYENAVLGFCTEWERHYAEHPEIYSEVNSDGKRKGPNKTFEKAVLAQNQLEHLGFGVKYYGGKANFTENILVYNQTGNPLLTKTTDVIKESFGQYRRKVEQLFKTAEQDADAYKEQLHSLILFASEMHVMELHIKKSALRKAEKYALSLDKYEDVAAFFNSLPTIERERLWESSASDIRSRISNKTLLEAFKVPKTSYFEYFKEGCREQLFPKYLFVNIAFLLSLNRTRMEKVLNLGGYYLSETARDFDRIVHNAFNMGWTQEQTNVVINESNKRLLRKNPDAIPSPTL